MAFFEGGIGKSFLRGVGWDYLSAAGRSARLMYKNQLLINKGNMAGEMGFGLSSTALRQSMSKWITGADYAGRGAGWQWGVGAARGAGTLLAGNAAINGFDALFGGERRR